MNQFSPRVVQVTTECTRASGGLTRSIENFARVLDSAVVSFTQPLSSTHGIQAAVTHVTASSSILGRHYAAPRRLSLPKAARRLLASADLLSCHLLFRYHVTCVVAAASRHAVPYWVVPHGGLDPFVFGYRRFRKKLWMALIGRKALREAAYTIFATRRERDKALASAYCRPFVLHWPTPPAPARCSEAVSELRKTLGLPDEDRVLVTMGRLHSSKRLIETIDALGAADVQKVHLLVVGPDTDTMSADRLREHATATGTRNVHVVGPSYGPSRFRYYQLADGFISLSAKENFGYTLAEAMACGLPTIASRGIDLCGEFAGTECGWILPDDSSEAAVGSIRAFAQADLTRLREMGAAGKAWAQRELAPEVFADRLRELAAETCAMRRRPYVA